MRNLIFSEAWLIGLTSQRLWQITQEEIINKSVGRLGSRELAAAVCFEAWYRFWIYPDPGAVCVLLPQPSHAAVTAALCSLLPHALSLSPVQINSIASPRRMPENPQASRPTAGFYLLNSQGQDEFFICLQSCWEGIYGSHRKSHHSFILFPLNSMEKLKSAVAVFDSECEVCLSHSPWCTYGTTLHKSTLL